MMLNVIKNNIDIDTEFQISNCSKRVPIYHIKKSGAPFTVRIVFDIGSGKDPIPGTTHFLEHMLVSGTKKYPLKQEIANLFSSKGALRNAFTSRNTVSIVLYLNDCEDVLFAKEMLNEYLFNSIFESSTLEKERTAIFDEIRRYESNFNSFVLSKIYQYLYPNQKFSYPVTGLIDDVEKITRDQLIRHLQESVLTSRSCIMSSGDFDVIEIEDLARSISDKLPEIFNIEELDKKYVSIKTGRDTLTIDQKSSCVFLGYDIPSIEDRIGKAFMSFISWKLFSQSGLLIKKLRFEKGLTYSVRDVSTLQMNYAFFGTLISCDKEKMKEVEQIAIDIVEQDLWQQLTKEEIENYIFFIKKTNKRTYQVADMFIEKNINSLMCVGENTIFPNEIINILEKSSIEELQNFVRKYFTENNRKVIWIQSII